MNGTTKQVEWAENIRSAMMAKRDISESLASEWEAEGLTDRAAPVRARTASIEWDNENATYWIETFKHQVRRGENGEYWQEWAASKAGFPEMHRRNSLAACADEYIS